MTKKVTSFSHSGQRLCPLPKVVSPQPFYLLLIKWFFVFLPCGGHLIGTQHFFRLCQYSSPANFTTQQTVGEEASGKQVHFSPGFSENRSWDFHLTQPLSFSNRKINYLLLLSMEKNNCRFRQFVTHRARAESGLP